MVPASIPSRHSNGSRSGAHLPKSTPKILKKAALSAMDMGAVAKSSIEAFPARQEVSDSSRPRTRMPQNRPEPTQADRGTPRGRRQLISPASQGPPPSSTRLSGPILRPREPWQTWSELTVRVTNLPSSITTWELWRRFEPEGTVVFVEIFENRQGAREGTAKIRFSPPPHRDFWATDNVVVSTPDDQGAFQVKVEPEPKKRRFEIQSPIRKTVWYPESLALYPSTIGFGLMRDELTMMNMYSAEASLRGDMRFGIDLLRGRITTTFQVALIGPQTGTTAGAENHPRAGVLDRVNKYMFMIPFGQLQKIYKVDVSENQWALIISLETPPQFFRKRLDPKASHEQKALTWSEFDTWYRQTDIVYDPRRLEVAPVALKKELPVIDIGRWTTYRLIFEKSQDDLTVFETIRNALQDYNIEIVHLHGFATSQCPPEASAAAMWSMVDPPKSDQIPGEVSVSLQNGNRDYALPFQVRYQLEVCISQGLINEHNITQQFVDALAQLVSKDETMARHVLEYVVEQEKRIFDPMAIFTDTDALAYSPKSKIPHYCAYSRKATITPTTLYYSSPTVETTNRVIRKYSESYGDRFLRVQFTDEKSEGRINSCVDKARNDELFTRVFRTLRNGIQIGDRHYQFLAFGNSQFRENGAYFFCPTEHLTCADIRHWMGDFTNIRVVAKYAARLGLCFSTTRAIHSSGVRIVPIDDIERNGYCFTDGVGKISEFLASMIATELGLPHSAGVPSAFQFRLGGCKGILTKWPDAKGQEVHIRKSQSKFRAIYNGLEIIRCARYSPATLNRQTITILSSLGVPDKVFNTMLSEQLSNYELAMRDEGVAMDLLTRYIDDNHMTVTLAAMITDGFMQTREPFVMSLLHLWRAWSMKLLKEKARIIVESGAFLLGVTDETQTLRGHSKSNSRADSPLKIDDLPQIFVQVPDKSKKGGYVVIEGLCLLGRNPSLYPGDIRVVQAVNVPALHHLRDVVVFSQLGDRDVPSMCSGGDLDGDDFFCIWDTDLIPPESNPEPMKHNPPKAKELNRRVEIEDVMKFFTRFMKNDSLPTIAHAHLALADFLDRGVKDPKCLELAVLHSKAVDYVKTGEPAEMPKYLKPRKWPHFMEKKYKPKEQIYISQKILGQLYDQVESVSFVPQYEERFDQRILNAFPTDKASLKLARQLKTKYDTAIRRIMAQEDIQTEFEVWSTFVMSKPRVGSDYKMQENMARISGALKDRFRHICVEAAGGKEYEKVAPFAVAMYRVTWEEMEIALHECRTTKIVGGKEVPKRKMESKYMPLISFPWLFSETIGRIATGLERQYGELGNLDISFLKSKPETKRSHNPDSGIEEFDNEDYVETTKGVTHRGELLELFRPDDLDSEGDEVENPYGQVGSLEMSELLGGSGIELMEDLFAVNTWISPAPVLTPEPRQGNGIESTEELLVDTSISPPTILTPESSDQEAETETEIEIEEILAGAEEESPLEKLAKLTGS